MSRSKRRVNLWSYSQQVKKSRSSDHMSDDDAMDLDHSGADEKLMEKLEKSYADVTHDGEDDDTDEESKDSEVDEEKNLGGSDNKDTGGSTDSEEDDQEGSGDDDKKEK
eukprot:4017609-Ditylum_brightwellii.AAC.1